MAVVKSPKNVKRKNLWAKKIADYTLNNSVNQIVLNNKTFKSKSKKWTNAKSKTLLLKGLTPIYIWV